ncbi:MAG: hypothetical protein KDJ22_07960 [Candidatus Competibacteraceae bacterium]|nr:hypothetical protein [Candidatus Competibacteraceae bacterium]
MLIQYVIAWFSLMGLAILNGALRDLVYRKWIGEFHAHQLSTLTLLLLFAGEFWMLFTIWPLASSAQAWTVGTGWLVMTLAFEFGFGHGVSGHSWRRLLGAYRLHEGQLWSLIPLWVWIGPAVFFRALSA